jgi:hypothetical protein
VRIDSIRDETSTAITTRRANLPIRQRCDADANYGLRRYFLDERAGETAEITLRFSPNANPAKPSATWRSSPISTAATRRRSPRTVPPSTSSSDTYHRAYPMTLNGGVWKPHFQWSVRRLPRHRALPHRRARPFCLHRRRPAPRSGHRGFTPKARSTSTCMRSTPPSSRPLPTPFRPFHLPRSLDGQHRPPGHRQQGPLHQSRHQHALAPTDPSDRLDGRENDPATTGFRTIPARPTPCGLLEGRPSLGADNTDSGAHDRIPDSRGSVRRRAVSAS